MTTPHDLSDGPIQPLARIDSAPPVTTSEELRQRWRSIFGTEGFGRHSLWLILFDHGHQAPAIIPIDDIPSRLDEEAIDRLVDMLDQLADLADSVAFALTRPGTETTTDLDRGRAADLLTGFGRAVAEGRLSLRLWPLHLAVGTSVRAITQDDLGSRV